jgi:hypothetical protein
VPVDCVECPPDFGGGADVLAGHDGGHQAGALRSAGEITATKPLPGLDGTGLAQVKKRSGRMMYVPPAGWGLQLITVKPVAVRPRFEGSFKPYGKQLFQLERPGAACNRVDARRPAGKAPGR